MWREEEVRNKKEEASRAGSSRPSLNGQYLSQYQASQSMAGTQNTAENDRIRELERQLEEAKEREKQYQRERVERTQDVIMPKASPPESPEPTDSYRRPATTSPLTRHTDSWAPNQATEPRQVATNSNASNPSSSGPSIPEPISNNDPASTPMLPSTTRTDRFLASNPAPSSQQPRTHFPAELGMTSESERAGEDSRRLASQQRTTAGGRVSKSLLEREMERERERQREWAEEHAEKTRTKGLVGPRELKR